MNAKRRSARLALLEAAFTNWRVPGYLGSIAYRLRRVSPLLFDRLMSVRLVLRTRRGPSMVARLRDVNGPAEVFGLDEYENRWLDWSRVDYVLDAGAHVGGFPRIDLLKMDIEGAEHEVFGAVTAETLRLVDFWMIERHPVPNAVNDDIAGLLLSAGFDVSTVAKPLGLELITARRRAPR